jgi:hypothetical protein
MQSLLERIDVEMRCLVLRENIARCHRLVQAEPDPLKRRQYRCMLNASQYAEARFLRENGFAVPSRSTARYSRDVVALLALDETVTARSADVIDFAVAKRLRANRSRQESFLRFSQQWPSLSNAQQARWLAALAGRFERRLALVLRAAEAMKAHNPLR